MHVNRTGIVFAVGRVEPVCQRLGVSHRNGPAVTAQPHTASTALATSGCVW